MKLTKVKRSSYIIEPPLEQKAFLSLFLRCRLRVQGCTVTHYRKTHGNKEENKISEKHISSENDTEIQQNFTKISVK